MRVAPRETVSRTGALGAWPWLVGLNGLTFAVQRVELGGAPIVERAVPTGAGIDAGEVWRPVTSLLVHPGGLPHLVTNSALLLLVAPRAQRELGSRGLLVTYVGIGFAANALRYAVGGRTGGGASAGIFAVAGAALAGLAHRRGHDRAVVPLTMVAVSAGLGLAAAVGDNHALALGLGAECASSRAGSPSDGTSRRRVAGIAVASAAALLARVLRS